MKIDALIRIIITIGLGISTTAIASTPAWPSATSGQSATASQGTIEKPKPATSPLKRHHASNHHGHHGHLPTALLSSINSQLPACLVLTRSTAFL